MNGIIDDWRPTGGGLMGSWFNPGQSAASVLPAPVAATPMPTSADLGWSLPNLTNPFSYGSQGIPLGVTTTPETAGGNRFMQMLRGNPNTPGDGFIGWLGNGENLGALAQTIGALTGAWLGYNQLKIAKDQLNFQKSAWQKNYANSVKSYNTSLEDRIRGRTADYAGKENDVQSYLAKHKLG